MTNRLETLKAALEARDDELENYQINIDNYTRAIAKIEAEYKDGRDAFHVEMQKFADQMRELLRTSLIEQNKARIIRDVIAEQCLEME